jgi:glycosyltransferase involved in cell wall biosynthesis
MLTGAASLTGVDADAEAIRYGLSRFPGIDFRVGRMEVLPLESNSFDVVVCLEGLEHLYLSDATLFLAEARRVLRPNGRIIVTVPLLQDGRRHSGNPYHRYEFTQAGLRNLLEQHFETVSLETFESGEGPEALYLGQPVDRDPAPLLVPERTDLCGRVSRWLDGMRAGDGFRFAAATPSTLLSTCIAILLHEGLESLDGASPETRESWLVYVQACQDPSTGLFVDPLLDQIPTKGEEQDRAYLELLMTYFAIHALDALDARALYPLLFLAPLEAPSAIAAWLNGLNWGNLEIESNRVMFLLAGLIHRAEKEGHPAAPGLYHQVLDWLDRAQDIRTGLWGTQKGASLAGAIAGAYRFFSFYEFVHRPVCSVAKIIDAALSLQQDDGLFGPDQGGGASEDLAVVDLLAAFTKRFDYRASDIKKVLVRSFWSNWNLQNTDDGFPFASRANSRTYRFGSWAPLEMDPHESDVWASWLRVLALETVRSTYPEDLPEIGGWRFRRLPALGFHRAGPGLSNLEKKRLPVWLRPLSLPPGATPPDTNGDATRIPEVSVVITCYNLGLYLYEAVDSVLRQTRQSFEIILVDDGSTEEFTTLYLDLFTAPRTQVVRTANQGLPAARNTGIQLARGRYICCLDADDRLKPAYLDKTQRILDDAEDVGFASCYYETFDAHHSVYRYDYCRFPELLVQNEAVVVSLFRKEAWRKVGGYYTGLKAMEDWDFWIGILEQGYRGEVIPEILFEYRVRIGSMYSVARRPENYSVLARQITDRHQDSYRRHFLEVLRLKTSQFAELVAIRQQELEEFARGKNWLEEQVRSWQQLAWQRQKDLVAYEAGKAWLEEQVRGWQRAAEAQRQRIAELEDLARLAHASIARIKSRANSLAVELERWRQTVKGLEMELEHWRQAAEERERWIGELDEAKRWLVQHADNWRAVAENWETAAEQRRERIGVLEETIVQMRATRAWRFAEWSVRVWRGLSGICRSIMLVGSPRFVPSNAKNVSLALKLKFGPAEGHVAWGARFDANYYNWAYPDVARSGVPPWLHYLLYGYKEDRNPSASFDSAQYYRCHPDVREAGINPLLHYALFGREEQRTSPPPRTALNESLVPKSAGREPARPWSARAETSSLEDQERPLVSVVIPCFNYGQYVEQAIRSVLSQTFTNIEIIVVEGGSSDGTTPEALRNLERKGLPRTSFVYRTESHLVGDNRNFGIGLARGRYVCCLDADDLLKPIYIEMAIFLAECYGYDLVYPSVRSFGEDDFHWMLGDPTWPEIANGNQISTVAMFRKGALETIGGFRDWGKGEQYVPEDWELWVRIVGHGFRGKSIREPLMLYRVHASGLWSTRRLPLQQQREAIREANPELFVDGFVLPTPSLDRPATPWSNLIEPTEANPPILFALPFIINGGAEKVFATLARSLIQRGHKVIMITTLVPAKTIPDCTESFEAVTPHLYSLPRLLQNQEERWRDFLYFLLKRHQVGMILIGGCDFVYQLLPEIAEEFPQIAILDQLFNDGVHFQTNRRHAAYIDTTFVPSQKLADKLISEGGEEAGKVCVIPHGIDIEDVEAPNASFDSGKLPEHFRGKFLVSFFGRLSVEKAPADFIEIAKRLRSYDEICFLMTGEGQERATVLALIKRYGMQGRIHTPGFVDNVHTLLALSDVIVVPSHLDGMPLVVFEAQACGKPVVASAVGSIPHVIDDGKTGLLCTPGDVDGFAERILTLWRSPEMRRAIGDAASIWVRANHSAESMNAKYVETFDRVQARGRSTAVQSGEEKT